VHIFLGVRTVFPVGSPLVYRGEGQEPHSENEDEVDDDDDDEHIDEELQGGKAADLAGDIILNLKLRLELEDDSLQYMSGKNLN